MLYDIFFCFHPDCFIKKALFRPASKHFVRILLITDELLLLLRRVMSQMENFISRSENFNFGEMSFVIVDSFWDRREGPTRSECNTALYTNLSQ